MRVNMAAEIVAVTNHGARIVPDDGFYVRTYPVEEMNAMGVGQIENNRRMNTSKRRYDLLETILG